ncbi:MAG: pilin [Patescibacteria group bacterium]|jgi:type IV secretory pathway VirB2 component (pilin)
MNLVEKAYAVSKNQWTGLLNPTATTSGNWQDIVNNVINIVLMVAGALAVIYLIYSGILYITAAGNPDSAKKGQQGIINAVIGIVIIVAAFFIVRAAMGLAGQATK